MKKLFGWFLLSIALLMALKNSQLLPIYFSIISKEFSLLFVEAPILFAGIPIVIGVLIFYTRYVQAIILKNNIHSAQLLGAAVALRDHGTAMHNFRVALGACRMGEALGLSKKSIQGLMKGAFLHDIGKIGINDLILKKPSRLQHEESLIMQQHVKLGEELLDGWYWFKDAQDVVRYHHEKYDGSGYLQQLRGQDIPLAARIFCIIDVFDALMSKRPYKEAFSYEQAITIIQQQSGTHFDPAIVDTFISIASTLRDELYNNTEDELKNQLVKRRKHYFGA